MKLPELEREGYIRRLPADEKKVRDSFELARRDLKTARIVMETDYDWAFTIAYNSMLQSSRALMFSMGYRSHGSAQHVSAVRFAEAVFGDDFSDIIVAFDRMRRKRHIAVYGAVGLISKEETRNAVKRAGEFISKVKERLQRDGFLSNHNGAETRRKPRR